MGLADNDGNYYGNEVNSGSYQFTSLDDVVNQFIIAYVGEDKIISKVKRTDVAFHAQRALQELSFDTFKSVKSHELTVPPSLRLMLPNDYVNYTNISWSDSSGIQHTIFPTNKTSNPQYKGNLVSNSQLNENADGWTLGTGWEWTNYTHAHSYGGGILGTSVALGEKISITVDVKMGRSYDVNFTIRHPDPVDADAAATTPQAGNLKVTLYGDEGYKHVYGDTAGIPVYLPTASTNMSWGAALALNTSSINFTTTTDTDSQLLVIEPGDTAFTGIIDRVRVTDKNDNTRNLISKTWDSYRSNSSSSINDANAYNYDTDIYDLNIGQRYGLDPQHAQTNGSFFIDNDILHLSSNLGGKTLVLKYISDSLGTNKEMKVHKFAEEAIYKWIAHAILSTRANVPEYQVNRFKKERFAAIRQAKLRLSNLKIEEITQVLRGKSKQIKH